jgi:short-subunit dehydrogenase
MQNKVVAITGASSGIGAALAELVATQGASVALIARREDALRAVAARCGERAVHDTLHRFGRLDVWVNNAGRGITRPPSELTDEDVDDMMRVNVKSVLYGMQEVLPVFKAGGAGHVINISSMLGRVPFATFRSAYSASKHYVNALTAMFRDELRQTHPGIQISLVSPGVVRTEFGLNAQYGGPDSRQLPGGQSAEEVAAVIADVIARPRPDVYTRPGSRAQVVDYYTGLGADAG